MRWQPVAAFGAGIGILGYWIWKIHAPESVLLFITDTHGSAVSNAALADALRAEVGVTAILHGGDVADTPELFPTWWDRPFRNLPAPVRGARGNHDDPDEFARRFGRHTPLRLPGVDVFFLPWGWRSAAAETLARQIASSTARHRILVVHKPILPDGGWEMLLPSLERIDLVLAGHEHVFADQSFPVGDRFVRQIVEVSGPKKYRCRDVRPDCLEGTTGYLRIEAGRDLVVERRVLP
ncbi:MAG: metallophosphoesterase [Chloroflexota bacterium]